ncbi:Gfo/Idh/MocA family protein [Aquiflexum gelatinilyticum]|uniref:Gfo/Idh/MocA family oxidoreductase n=1 Tax=Aquiflexum gelatinilyticum TaxID=2961943 RepID=A0A9X2T1D6_9BACT|nr:Gfo/Idh/MocA family oxidoreductase [Aquiflexum gelatinilyticum]MCR9015816.1 Gfo/Idh/MocA family oxidoreductase [Aquiflexum gelatinilyticum]
MNSRRKFIQNGILLSAGLSMPGMIHADSLSALTKKIAPSDQLNFAVIGCKGMGWSNMNAHLKMPNVNCVAIADIDQSVLDQRSEDVNKQRGKKPQVYKDYRKMLENKDIDAVIIGTPDHWHCLTMVDSLSAGKHVYVEKPIANTIEECNLMVKAKQRYGKMVQVGQWQRSGSQYAEAIAYVKSGKLGQIRLVKTWAYQGWMKPVPVKPNGPVPQGVDYDMWLGPAPKRPFNENRFHFNFRWFWDYAGGLMTDWGVHEIDIALFAMGVTAPKSVMASGGKFAYPDDASETPDTLQTVYEYDGFNMLWEHATGIDGGNYGTTEGIAFIGNNATLVVNRGGWKVIPETENKDGKRVNKIEEIQLIKPNGNALEIHAKGFVSSIIENDASKLTCGIETGSIAAINAQMGNIAYKTGKKVYWDANKGQFTDPEANALMKANYHNGWKLPTV